MRLTNNYDVLIEGYRTDDLLLLHPDLIEEQLEKIKKKCPIKIIEKDGIKYNVLIPNIPIESSRYTEEFKYSIPVGVIIPICGLKGRYCIIKNTSSYVDSKTDLTMDGSYRIIDKKTGKELYFGTELRFLSNYAACLDDLLITKNMLIPWTGSYISYSSGYLSLEYINGVNFTWLTYDTEGNLASVDYTVKDAMYIGKNAPEIVIPNFNVNTEMFEHMIIESLKDRKELQGCAADNLIDIVNFLHDNNIDITIDLDSLAVYKVNYKKFFNKILNQNNNGISFAKKPKKQKYY